MPINTKHYYSERPTREERSGKKPDQRELHEKNPLIGADDNDCTDVKACDRLASIVFDANVPVSVKPYAKVGRPEVKCIGGIKMHLDDDCHDNEDDTFEFTLTQKMIVCIPVKCGAVVCHGETSVDELGSDCKHRPEFEPGYEPEYAPDYDPEPELESELGLTITARIDE